MSLNFYCIIVTFIVVQLLLFDIQIVVQMIVQRSIIKMYSSLQSWFLLAIVEYTLSAVVWSVSLIIILIKLLLYPSPWRWHHIILSVTAMSTNGSPQFLSNRSWCYHVALFVSPQIEFRVEFPSNYFILALLWCRSFWWREIQSDKTMF